jgi:membrane peptidoglycan carboxypeptidase
VARPSIVQSIGVLAAVSIVAGILMAGMLLPFVGGVGLAARTATTDFGNLPANLKRPPLPEVSRVLDDKGKTIATFYDQDRVNVPLSAIPLQMQTALIDTEDVRFYEHAGIDIKGSLRALFNNSSSGSVSQGGSTLTQQYVKNVLIESAHTKKQREAAIADTFARKIKEARYALELEKKLTKSQILDDYFNIAYFGDGAYGIGTAAHHFFSEPVSKLTLDQSALLAGLVQSPEAYDPVYYPKLARERRDTVLGQMLKYHSIDQATYDEAVAQPIVLKVHNQPADCIAAKSPDQYFCDYVKNVFKHTKGLSLSMLRRGGLTVTTTLDPKVQEAAEKGIHQYVHAHERKSHVVSAEAVVQPGTGEVKALAVSTPYGNNPKKGQNSIDYAVDQKWGGSPGFHAGSTFKLFVLTAALKEGIPLSTRIKAPSDITINGLTNCAGLPVAPWPVHNAGDGESGTFNLESGTWFSVNTFYAQLEQRTGLCEPVKLAEAMGVTQGTGKPPEQIGPFVLGGGAQYGFTPLDVAGAYATMAAHGKYCSPIVITSIVDRNGNSYPVPQKNCQQVVPPGLANTVTSILQGVLTFPGATGTSDALTNRPAAAKTGTVDNYDGSWFAGYTPQLASAVWAGIPAEPNKTLDGLTIGGVTYGEVFGATIAGKIWQATMNAALKGDAVVPFSGPDSFYEIGIQTKVPDVTGDAPGNAETILSQAGFSPQIEAKTVHSTEKAGTVARTSPPGGSESSIGATVKIFISDGIPPKPKKSPSPPPTSPPPTSPPPTPPPTTTPTATPTGTPTHVRHGHHHHRHHRH